MRNFKFFRGYIDMWIPTDDYEYYHVRDVEDELINSLSEQIAQEIDNNIIEELTRRINSGMPPTFEGRIQRLNSNLEYFNRWMDIGGQRA